MSTSRQLLAMTTAAAFCAAPLLAFGQASTDGGSRMPAIAQATPQPGPAREGMPGTGRPGTDTTGAATPGIGVDSARLQGGRRASQVIGANVVNENNETIGEVDDLVVVPGGGQPVAVLSVGGFLGIGARLIAVPYERLQYNAERERWMLQGATRDSLRSLPEFTYPDERRRG